MSKMKVFDIIKKMSGINSSIVIQRPYIELCKGNYNQAVVLSQLVFWSGTKRPGEYFYKTNADLSSETSMSVDQVRYAVKQLKKALGDVLKTKTKKANGYPTLHYSLDADALIELIYEKTANSDNVTPSKASKNPVMGNLPQGNGNSPESIWENSHNQGCGKITITSNRSLPDHNNTDLKDLAPSKLDAAVVFELKLNDKSFYKIFSKGEFSIEYYQELYQGIDVLAEFREMKAWLDANPTRRKTKTGIKSFITRWLSKAQNTKSSKSYQLVNKKEIYKPDEKVVLRNKISQIEQEINAESQAKVRFATAEVKSSAVIAAIESCDKRIKKLTLERKQLVREQQYGR